MLETATINSSTQSNGISREITAGSVLKVLWRSGSLFRHTCGLEIDRDEILSIIGDGQSGM